MGMFVLVPIGSILALLFSFILTRTILAQSEGNAKMQKISKAIRKGAYSYLKRQYVVVGIFFAVLFVILSILSFGFKLLSPFVPFAFLTGGFFS
ncbi:Inorganic H+ pyrophosphatase, partial [Candidatus Magnetomorum sp. HK-1]